MTHTDAVELLKRLIATPSPSREESAAADLVEAEFARRGFAPRRNGNASLPCCSTRISTP